MQIQWLFFKIAVIKYKLTLFNKVASYCYIPVFQRPRKIGAKFTGDNIAPDEYITPALNFDYEGKRDHAAGVDVEDHQRKVREEYGRLEEVPVPINPVVILFPLLWVSVCHVMVRRKEVKVLDIHVHVFG